MKNKKRDDVAYLMVLGMVAYKWAHMEKQLEFTIWAFSSLKEKQGAAITTHMSIPQKLQAIKTLGELKFKGDVINRELNSLIKRTEVLSTERNNFLHGLWNPKINDEHWVLSLYKARGKLQYERRPVPVEEILLIERSIDALGEDWDAFHKAHLADTTPLNGKPSQPGS